MPPELTPSQARALETLTETRENVFVTGVAGSGKSFLIRRFMNSGRDRDVPILASTGAAAILVGGRTFHSFFGLGILEGGLQKTVERAMKNAKLRKRLEKTDTVVIDEISMISGTVLRAAETIARKARNSTAPWGGLRVVAVGDFAQLPPVNPHWQAQQQQSPALPLFAAAGASNVRPLRDWAFLDEAWARADFTAAVLPETMRTSEPELLHALNAVRAGTLDREAARFLNSRTHEPPGDFDGTRLFGRRADTERFNLEKLGGIRARLESFETSYSGKARAIEDFKKNAPVPEVLQLKKGALVMIRQNDPEGRWVNGSTGRLREIDESKLTIELEGGREVDVKPATFQLLDAEGQVVAAATNFPVNLAYAMTVHKAQGATLEKLRIELRGLWEPGQAYVALSRARSAAGLYVEGWDARSIKVDPVVADFHRSLGI